MCYSQAEGGQRCYSHAKDRYDRALDGYRENRIDREALAEVETEFASTPQGQQNLETRLTNSRAALTSLGRVERLAMEDEITRVA